MLPYQRIKRLYPLKPHVKKANLEDRHHLKVPQYMGIPGWLFLTHNEHGDPIAMFIDKNDKVDILYIVFDERLFSDTIFRVVRLGLSKFIVYDIRYLNGRNFYETHTYEERTERIENILNHFHYTDMIALITPAEVPNWEYPIRGHEYYDSEPGSMGVFIPVEK
jgi:hypothetical protein